MRSVACAAVALLLFATAPAPAEPGGDAERNRTIVRDAFADWAAGGNVFDALLADDVEWTIVGTGPAAGVYRGRADLVERGVRPLVSRLATPIVPSVRAIWSEGDTVVVRFDGSATTRSGAPYRNRFVWILGMEDGRVVRAEAFLDLAAYRAAIEGGSR